ITRRLLVCKQQARGLASPGFVSAVSDARFRLVTYLTSTSTLDIASVGSASPSSKRPSTTSNTFTVPVLACGSVAAGCSTTCSVDNSVSAASATSNSGSSAASTCVARSSAGASTATTSTCGDTVSITSPASAAGASEAGAASGASLRGSRSGTSFW